jgi:2,6-dihydroxypseudooxynicotine hydrolase
VDPNDFARVTGTLERWEDWLGAWSANGDLHAGLAREAEDRGWPRTAGEAWARAAVSYHFGKFVWMLDMAAHDAAAAKAVAAMGQAHRLLDPTAERVEVAFGGAAMVGNLRRPPGLARPPLVLLIAGLDSTKEEFFAVENIFLARGMATFSLDGPGQGESARTLKIRPDFEAPVAAVLDVLCKRPDLDGDRVGVLGVSLGGYYGARAAAFEPRIRAVVVSGGCYDYGSLIRDRAPHSFATFAYGCGAATREEAYEIAGRMSLAGVTERIAQPMIVVFGKRDRLVPWQHAARVAAEAPHADLWMFDEGNHVCMNLTYRWRPQAADWLAGQLAA